MVKAGDREVSIADRITQNLTALTRQLAPGEVVPGRAVQKILGIPYGAKRPVGVAASEEAGADSTEAEATEQPEAQPPVQQQQPMEV